MAKLVASANIGTLQQNTTSLSEQARRFLLPNVSYDQEILDSSIASYGDNPSLAIALSGSSDKKSKEYKASLRVVQQWRKGKSTPSKVYQRKLIQSLDKKGGIPEGSYRKAAGTITGTVTVSITGYVQISNTPAEYRTLHAGMSGSILADFLDMAATGDSDEALAMFAEAGKYPVFDLYSSPTDPITVKFS